MALKLLNFFNFSLLNVTYIYIYKFLEFYFILYTKLKLDFNACKYIKT